MFVLEIFDCTICNQTEEEKESILCNNLNRINDGDKSNRSKVKEKFKNSRIAEYVSSNKNISLLIGKFC